MPADSATIAEAMRHHLERLKALRGEGGHAVTSARVAEVKRWQTERLNRTYADLQATSRYRAATRFFVEDLYGPKDFTARDAARRPMVPGMGGVLSAKAVETGSL